MVCQPALHEKDDVNKVLLALQDPDKYVVVQICLRSQFHLPKSLIYGSVRNLMNY